MVFSYKHFRRQRTSAAYFPVSCCLFFEFLRLLSQRLRFSAKVARQIIPQPLQHIVTMFEDDHLLQVVQRPCHIRFDRATKHVDLHETREVIDLWNDFFGKRARDDEIDRLAWVRVDEVETVLSVVEDVEDLTNFTVKAAMWICSVGIEPNNMVAYIHVCQ